MLIHIVAKSRSEWSTSLTIGNDEPSIDEPKQMELESPLDISSPEDFSFDFDGFKTEVKEAMKIDSDKQFDTNHKDSGTQNSCRLPLDKSSKDISVNNIIISKPPKNHTQATQKQIQAEIECTICPRTFTKMQLMKRHSKTHTKEPQKIICGYKGCEFPSKGKNDVKLHWQKVHAPKECDICEKSFKSTLEFMYFHKESIHKKYLCDLCKEFFDSKEILYSHRESIHSVKVKRQYMCHLCSYNNYKMKEVQTHLSKQHHIGTNQIFYRDGNNRGVERIPSVKI